MNYTKTIIKRYKREARKELLGVVVVAVVEFGVLAFALLVILVLGVMLS